MKLSAFNRVRLRFVIEFWRGLDKISIFERGERIPDASRSSPRDTPELVRI